MHSNHTKFEYHKLSITDGNIIIRPFSSEDAAAHLEGDDEQQSIYLNGGHISTEKSVNAWIAKNEEYWRNDGPIYNFAIVDNDRQPIGMVEANTDSDKLDGLEIGDANISYALYPKARGKGYTSRAIKLLEQFLIERGLIRSVIRVNPDNKASLKVPERLNYYDNGQIITRDGDKLRIYIKNLVHTIE